MPLFEFECENRHLESGTVNDVLEFLYERGYDGHFVHGKDLVAASQFDPTVHQKENGERFFAHKDYCNNFIFRKKN